MTVVSLFGAYRGARRAPARSDELVTQRLAELVRGEAWARFTAGFAPRSPSVDWPALDEEFETQVTALTRETTERCAALLDLADVKVVLLPESPENAFVLNRMGGVAGLTAGAGVVLLRVAPTTSWPAFLVDAVAHELHHASWVHTRGDVDRAVDLPLVEAVVMEGRACVFAGELQPDFVAPWTRALTEVQARDALTTFGEVLRGTRDVNAGAFLFGGPDFAPWTGYEVGTRVVSAFRARHPDVNWQELTRLDANEVALGSGALPCRSASPHEIGRTGPEERSADKARRW